MALSNGTRLGPYEILGNLGAGGMGEVYRAKDPRIGREVAVKVIHSAFAKDPERLARFEQEARSAGALNHPNILTIYDVGGFEDSPYLVTELLEGETLREKLGAPISVKKAVDIAAQIARGLSAAHDKGIVHRDLKPENIFITQDGRVKILDFGLAKLTLQESSTDPENSLLSTTPGTGAGVVLGTVGYMSPEQVRGQAADARSDIFALGAVLYEMLTGVRAFRGASPADTMSAILNIDPPELSVAAGRPLPPGLERIVKHCLEKEASARFRSAHDIAFDLESASSSSSSGFQAVAPARLRSRSWIALGSVIALIALSSFIGIEAGKRIERTAAQKTDYTALNFRPEMIFNSRFAPDGRTVLYSAALSGNEPELFAISPEYPESRSLGLKQTALLSVSSKGELALLTNARYINQNFFIGTLSRMPIGGGTPREILNGVREADWSPDGSELAIIREINGLDRLEYPAGKVLCQTSGYFSDLRFSPDGKRIAFFEHPLRYDDRGSVLVIDLEGKKTILSDGWWTEEGVAWSPDGKEIFFGAGEPGASRSSIFAVSLSGKIRRPLSGLLDMQMRDISRDGKWLASREEIRAEVFALPAGEKTERNLSWLEFSTHPFLSGDGRMLLFGDGTPILGPHYAVCLRSIDGSAPVRLGDGNPCGLSPDGKLALAYIPTDPAQMVLYPIGPGETLHLERGPITTYSNALWFPDGKRILITGNEPGHASRCYVQKISGGKPEAISAEGFSCSAISPDGNLVTASNETGQNMILPVGGGEPRPLPLLTPDDIISRWTPDGRSLLVFNRYKVPSPLDRVDLGTGQRETLRTLSPPDSAGTLKISSVAVADDLATYAYWCLRHRSQLYLVQGIE